MHGLHLLFATLTPFLSTLDPDGVGIDSSCTSRTCISCVPLAPWEEYWDNWALQQLWKGVLLAQGTTARGTRLGSECRLSELNSWLLSHAQTATFMTAKFCMNICSLGLEATEKQVRFIGLILFRDIIWEPSASFDFPSSLTLFYE